MIRFINKYVVRTVSIVLAIYMINLSVDVADHPEQFDPNVNEIESIIELVFEVVLDQGNVMSEEDEPDPEANTCFVGLNHIIPIPTFIFETQTFVKTFEPIGYIPSDYSEPYFAVNPHPPQV
ncbi:hypothetical protein [Marinoscillum pacificum]|uniref:hypothetical protein n=1 Tax=Marinoscillum pacificum TaxID=392723 RepID=UPI00215753FE|nr:hypothetical protein [Marinoscillum pacificum]